MFNSLSAALVVAATAVTLPSPPTADRPAGPAPGVAYSIYTLQWTRTYLPASLANQPTGAPAESGAGPRILTLAWQDAGQSVAGAGSGRASPDGCHLVTLVRVPCAR
jgi:hypothetical protein